MPNDDGVSKSYLLWNMATFYVSMLNFMWDTFKTTHLHRSHAWKFCVECVMDSCPLQVTFFANGQPLWIINVDNTYTIYTCGMYISQCVYKYCIRNNIDSIKVYKKDIICPLFHDYAFQHFCSAVGILPTKQKHLSGTLGDESDLKWIRYFHEPRPLSEVLVLRGFLVTRQKQYPVISEQTQPAEFVGRRPSFQLEGCSLKGHLGGGFEYVLCSPIYCYFWKGWNHQLGMFRWL